jgi:phage terminase large subunit GpA-like protein
LPVDGANAYRRAFLEGILPDEALSVSEWADRYVILGSRSSAEPGAYRSARTPYMVAVMDSLSAESPVKRVVCMMGGQVAKTTVGNNWTGYIIDHMPAPMMIVQPTVEMAKRVSKQRLDPMINDCSRLLDRIKPARSRDAGNTVLMKEFPNGILVLTGANSAVGLRSMSVRYLFLDEVDSFPGDVDGEGDPVMLAERGTRTFSNRKALLTSTPTFKNRSRIEREFLQSDQSYFHVPCPHCGDFQRIEWERIRWENDDPDTAHMICENCGAVIEESAKGWMLPSGHWIAEKPELSDSVRGFHLSSLYSPLGWFSWKDAVAMWLQAKGRPDSLRVFVNTVLAQTWQELGEAPPWEDLYNRREQYEIGTVPMRGLMLTAGVDVQKDRVEVSIYAFGRNRESWLVDHLVLPGDPTSEEPWIELDRIRAAHYEHESGAALPITMMAVDSGYHTQVVYSWVRSQPNAQVLAIKGFDNQALMVGQPSAVEVTVRGRRSRRGLKLWPLGVNMAKTEFYGWLRQAQPTNPEETGWPPGWCHFPQMDEEFFKQLTAEQIVRRVVRGYSKFIWEKVRDRNEALDCRVYARCAASVAGMDRWSDETWDKIESELGAGEPATRRQKTKQQRKPAADNEGYLDRWH